MNNIKRMIIKGMIKEYLQFIIFIAVMVILAFLGFKYSYFAYLVLGVYTISMFAIYFQSPNKSGIYYKIYKANLLGSAKSLELVNITIDSLQDSIVESTGVIQNNFFHDVQGASANHRNRSAQITINKGLTSSRKGRTKQINKNIKKDIARLNKIKNLLEIKNTNAWDK